MLPNKYPTLEGKIVSLRPLEAQHAKVLFEIAEGKNIWQWYPDVMNSVSAIREQVDKALQEFSEGKALPFVIFDKRSNEIVGTTRFFNVHPKDRHLEIGYTWIGPKWQGSGVNLESKYLLFKYAFEVLNCIRVELKTDSRNLQSQQAMRSLGLAQEGTLRAHMITHEGYHRDSVYFSTILKEWPEFKKKLEQRISRF